MPAIIWSHAELCLGVVSACLVCCKPALRGAIRMFGTIKSGTTSSKQPSSRSHAKPSTDAYKSLDGDGKESSSRGSKIALVSSDEWKNKAQTEIKGGVVQVDVELGVPHDAIGVTRDVDVSSMAAK